MLTVTGIPLTLVSWSQSKWALSLVSLVIAGIGLVITLRHLRRSWQHEEKPVGHRRLPGLPPQLTESRYRVTRSFVDAKDFLVNSKVIDRLLFDGADVALDIVEQQFEPALVDDVRRHLISFDRTVFDGRKIRLRTDLLEVPGTGRLYGPLHVQPTRYFHGMVTNDAAFKSLVRPHFDGMAFCYPGNQVPELNNSPASNHLGASTLAVTSDLRVVLTRQSRWSNISPNLLCPSGSGSADWNDLKPGISLQSLVKAMVERELCEECGIAPDAIGSTQIVGFGRIGWRGGKPEFFCLSVLRVPARVIRVPRRERRFETTHELEHVVCVQGQRSGAPLVEACKRILASRRDEVSYSLEWTLRAILAVPVLDLDATMSVQPSAP